MDTSGSSMTWTEMLDLLVPMSTSSLGEKNNIMDTNPKYIIMEKSRYKYVVLCRSMKLYQKYTHGVSCYFPYAECDSFDAAQKIANALNAAECCEYDQYHEG